MIIDEVCYIVSKSWSSDTCFPTLKDKWNDDNNSLGQCAVTALILNDFLGGKIMRCMCETGSHYYNLINNEVVDLTQSQFDEMPNYELSEERSREYLLSDESTKLRYKLLLENVKENFIKYGNKEYSLIDSDGILYKSKVPGTLGGNKKLKIYGKLDCESALYWINKGGYINNRVFFENERVAIQAGYRPCAKCMKNEYEKYKGREK